MRKILLSAVVVIVGFVGIEWIFRHVVPQDQAPVLQWDSATNMLRHKPNQTGVRYPDEDIHHPVRYTINAQGWNAPRDYDGREHVPVAMIGDSFVEALQVPTGMSVGGRLEAYLGPGDQVNRFGISGAPMSEYVHMARVVIARYHPDMIIVVLVHNDFTESFDPPAVPLYQAFERVNAQTLQTIPATPYQERAGSRVMASDWATGRATVKAYRDLVFLWQMLMHQWGHPSPEMGVDVVELSTHWPQVLAVTTYLFQQFATLRDETHTPILFVMDGVREFVHLQEVRGLEMLSPSDSDVYGLNLLAAEYAMTNHFSFVDLTPVFQADWMAYHVPFDFPMDYHWNSRTHDLVARTLLPEVQRVVK